MTDQAFTEGSRVEVRSDEEGFTDAWYEATICETTHSGEFLVQYHHLLDDEDESKLLIESVHVSCVRPCPPPADDADCFKMYEVVDAFYRDGWWTGVVTRAVVGSSKFLIRFENPREEMEFDGSDLRRHYDWVDGKWEKPPIKMGVILSKGTAIEISLQKKRRNVWNLGTVLQVTGKNNFLVEYQYLGASNKVENGNLVVDSLQIRPSPPCLEERDFALLENVEAFYNFCWWSGMINRVLEERVYEVILEHENKKKIFNQSDLRPHMDWINGKWTISSQETNQFATRNNEPLKWSRKKRRAKKPQADRHCAKTTAIDKEANATVIIEEVEKDCTIEEVGISVKEANDTIAVNSCDSPGKTCSNIMENQKQQIVNPGIQEINESTEKESNQKKRGRPRKSLCDKQIGSVGDDKICLSDLHRNHDMLREPTGIPLAESQKNETVSQKRRKVSHESLSNEQDEERKIVDGESQIQDCQHASSGKTSGSSGLDNDKYGDEMRIDGTFDDTIGDQTLNTWLTDMTRKTSTADTIVSPVGSLELSAEASGEDDESELPSTIAIKVKSSALQKTITNEPDSGVMPSGSLNQNVKSNDEGERETVSAMAMSNSVDTNQSLPFVKSSPAWKVFETMDIFHKTAQKPHFSPLEQCAEDIREGLAIAQMVIFSKMVEKASKLQFCEPRSMIESSLETLDGLESHGFDVKAIRLRLTELLAKKNKVSELQIEYKDIEDQLITSILEKIESEKEINELNEEFNRIILKMIEVSEKLTAATCKKEIKENEISLVKLKLDVVGEKIESLRL